MEEVLEKVDFLARSKYRVWILERLREAGPQTWAQLRAECDGSRATLQRNLDSLECHGWVRTVESRTYALTTAGRAVITHFSDLLDTVATTRRLRRFLRWFPAERFDIDVRSFADADITTPTPGDPYAPVNEQISAMESADAFRWLLPTVGPQVIRVTRDCVVERHERHEVVVDPAVAEHLRTTPDYADLAADLLELDHCEIRISDGEIPFYLGLTDDVIQVGAEDDEGIHRAVVETADEEVRQWAERTYERFRQNAERLEVE